MSSQLLPVASLSTTPRSSLSPSSSRIQHTLAQRTHIPAHVYKHPAAILLELCTSMEELHQIIPLIIKNGLYEEHLFQTKLVSLFCKYGSLTEATRVFEPIENKNDALYHTMLKGYAQNSSIFDGLSFYCRMIEDGVQPVVYNFTYLLKGCGENCLVKNGKQVHAQLILNGHEGDVYAMTCVVNMYAKCRLIDDAHKAFVRLPERDLVSWNTIIAGYAQNGFAGRAIELVSQMQVEQLKPDPITIISVLPAVALLDMYLKCGSLSTARVIFDKMSVRNVVSWNIMIDGYAESGDSMESLILFQKMLDDGIKPTGVTIMAALHACADSGDLSRGQFLHRLANELGLQNDIPLTNSLISMYSKCKQIEIAGKLFKNMKEKTRVSWNTMILGYAQNGRVIEALNHFRDMKLENIEPDSFTMVSIISAISESSILLQAKWIHGVVIRSFLVRNVFVKTSLVDMYAKCGAISIARKLFDLMDEKHITTWNAMIDGHSRFIKEGVRYFSIMKEKYAVDPTMDHYGAMVDLLGRSGRLQEAWDFILKMPVEPGVNIFGAMLGACRIHKNVKFGEMAAERLFKLNPTDGGYYVLLANLYASVSMWDKVNEIRTKMERKGIVKTPGFSSVDLGNEVHSFYSGSSWHSDSKKIYDFLETLIEKIKGAGYVADMDLMRDVEDDVEEHMVSVHSEKLAIAYGLLNTRPGKTIHIRKNLRVCGDCHNATKFISLVEKREIIVRDLHRFHHFKDGICSCGDYW
ncbi:unnamed protein product [Lactuca virosa]|uniref:DYW domain-containing protein n=1 Tax=Lactuca virosa TaxID=75947 RepID=A0AAU9LJS5_9ASTR|nr:unnamed protein product [Lactuca virosa]